MSKHNIYIQKEIWLIGLYRPLSIPSKPWESVSMEFMNQLLEWNGMDAIFVVVDRLSKLVKIVPTKTITTTFDLAKLFLTCGSSIRGCHNLSLVIEMPSL